VKRTRRTPRYYSIDQALDWARAAIGDREASELFRQVVCDAVLDESRPIRPQLARCLRLAVLARLKQSGG
jgi:hypothetical protein